jgi:hypothetical protein
VTAVDDEREGLAARIHAMIDASVSEPIDTDVRDALIDDVVAYQVARIPSYARLHAHARKRGDVLAAAVPTDAFRFQRLATFPESEDVRVFHTSGTTSGTRGMHALRDLSLYDHAARVSGKRMFFPDVERMRLVLFVPPEHEVADSSLGYMIARYAEWFGDDVAWVVHDGAVDVAALDAALGRAIEAREPVALLGTSFAFVHADDALGARRYALPSGSRIMQTGGFKGRSRTIEPDAMRAMLASRYGVPEPFIVAEYGMTELSSQLWESTLAETLTGRVGARRLLAPGWMRVMPVSPDVLAPIAGPAEGLFRLDDMVNLDTIAAIQTSDRVVRCEDGFLVLGRAEGATPRGCSIAADTLLGGHET